MARASPSTDSEHDMVPDKTKESEVESEEEEGEGEEYEIEAILDAKRGVFPGNDIGYLVKWKGYDAEHNSYVKTDDIGGAGDLVTAFWKKHPKKRAALFPASTPNKKTPRSSMARDTASDSGRKRGRQSTAIMVDSNDEDEAPSTSRATKKAKKSTNLAKSASVRSESPDPRSSVGDMSAWNHLDSWDGMVESIDTVERAEGENTLIVFMTLKDGNQVRVPSATCKEKLPLKLLNFYESNLRWKMAESED